MKERGEERKAKIEVEGCCNKGNGRDRIGGDGGGGGGGEGGGGTA